MLYHDIAQQPQGNMAYIRTRGALIYIRHRWATSYSYPFSHIEDKLEKVPMFTLEFKVATDSFP